ncbi:MAG: DUF2442 domain-containing protein [Bacteroidia bacterium]|nr:DUF2442 domain-containing protein [Bacteroidia bacterium]
MYKLKKIKPLADFKIWLKYSDDTEGVADLSHLVGKGVFRAWEKEIKFEKAYIDKESGALSWSKEIDLCPDNLYFKLKKVNPEDVFFIKKR